MTNQEIATLISERIGDAPIPFDSVRALAIQIYELLGGTEDDENFEDIYEILLAIIPIAHPGGGAIIDDNNVSTGTTWSSNKIVSELGNYATTNDISSFLVPNDVSIYATTDAVSQGLELKQDTLIPGDNITIQNNVISASSSSYNLPIATKNTLGGIKTGLGFITNNEGELNMNISAQWPLSIANEVVKNNRLITIQKATNGGYGVVTIGSGINVSNGEISVNPTDLSNYYTKSEIDNNLTLKADKTELENYATKDDVSIYATIANVDSSLTNYYTKTQCDELLQPKVNRTDLDIYIKFVALSQTDYNLLSVKDVSTLYLTNDMNINYVYIGNILIGGTNAVAVSPARLEYMTTDSLILWPTTLSALPTIIRNTYGSIFEYGGIEFSSYVPSISSIGNNAFNGNQTLSRFIIPNTVNSIGNSAFYGCSLLVYIVLGSGIKTIGLLAFSNTALTEIIFPTSLTTIGQQAFANCTSLNNITYIGTMADWETVTKNTGWQYNVPATVVHCTDGDVAI